MSDLSHHVWRVVIGENPASRLDKALAQNVPEAASLSRSQIGRLIEAGAVASEHGALVTELKAKTRAGDVFLITVPKVMDIEAGPEDIPLDVVFEDDDLIVVNKLAGMVVHPAPGSETGTLVNALLHHCGDTLSGIGGVKRPGIVHRIDKDTSGLLVVAKSDAAHHGLAAQFADHSITRHYRAAVFGVPTRADPRLAGVRGVAFEAGNVIRISGNIARHKHDRKRMAVVQNAGRHAITRLRVMEQFGADNTDAALVDCWLETGRTHQIRVHLAHAGHGLIGDSVYGGRRQLKSKTATVDDVTAVNGFSRQALHAATLGFVHPISNQGLEFQAALPADLTGLIDNLRSI